MTEEEILDFFSEKEQTKLPFAEIRKKLGYPPLRSKTKFEWMATNWQKEALGDRYKEGMTYKEANSILDNLKP